MKKLLFLTAFTLGCVTHIQAQNLLSNGSFESSAITGGQNAVLTESNDGWASSPNANLAIGTNDIVSAQNGNRFLIFNQNNSTPNGEISQTVQVELGKNYILSFWSVDIGGGLNFPDGGNLNASLGGVKASIIQGGVITQTQSVYPQITQQWIKNTLIFTATSNQATIVFNDISTVTTANDVGLDNIQLQTVENDLTNGLVAWYYGGSTLDQSGNGNNLTSVGVTLTNGINGQANDAFSFNGASSYMFCTNMPLPTNNAFTWSVWMKPSVGTTNPIFMDTVYAIGQNFLSPALGLNDCFNLPESYPPNQSITFSDSPNSLSTVQNSYQVDIWNHVVA